MDLAILEKPSQRLGDAVSAFDSALEDTENNFVQGRNEPDTECRRLLTEIDSDVSNIDERVCEIAEKIEKFKSFKGQTNNNNGGILMQLEKLEKQLQQLSNASSEFAAVLKDAQANFGADPNESDIQCIRLIAEIERNLSDVDRSIRSITEKIEQLKSFEGIL